jgi:hypothetical protein
MCTTVAANFLHSHQAIMYDKGFLTSLATEKPNRMLQQAENLFSVLKESLVCWTEKQIVSLLFEVYICFVSFCLIW